MQINLEAGSCCLEWIVACIEIECNALQNNGEMFSKNALLFSKFCVCVFTLDE